MRASLRSIVAIVLLAGAAGVLLYLWLAGSAGRGSAGFIAPPQADERGTAVEVLSRSADRRELLDWYRRELAADRSTTPPPRGALVSLEASIRAADMSAIELFAVGASAASNLDPWSASVWVRVATDKAMQELPPDPSSVNPSDTHVRELAMAMHDSGGPLWATGEYALLERQKAYNMRLSTGVLYAQVRVWARLGYAEALSRQGRRDEATAELDGIEADAAANPERYTREQLMEVHWARALMWSSAGRYADAIPHLDACANDPASGHSTSALSLLVDHLCKLGRGAEAEKRYVQYLERGQPDLPTRLMYAALVEDAKYRESSGRTGKPLGYTAPPGEGNSDEAPQTGAGQDGK